MIPAITVGRKDTGPKIALTKGSQEVNPVEDAHETHLGKERGRATAEEEGLSEQSLVIHSTELGQRDSLCCYY